LGFFSLLALDAPTVHSPAGALDLAAAGTLATSKTGRGAFCAKIDERFKVFICPDANLRHMRGDDLLASAFCTDLKINRIYIWDRYSAELKVNATASLI